MQDQGKRTVLSFVHATSNSVYVQPCCLYVDMGMLDLHTQQVLQHVKLGLPCLLLWAEYGYTSVDSICNWTPIIIT